MAISLATGRVLWTHTYNSPDGSPDGVNVVGGVVYATTNHAAFALDAATGKLPDAVRLVDCGFMTATLTWSGVTARRMARHALAEPATDLGPAAVAGRSAGRTPRCSARPSSPSGGAIAGATRAGVQHALWQRAHPGQDVRPPRHRPPAARRRPADVDRGAVGPAVAGADPPGGRPVHPRAGGRGRRGHRRRAGGRRTDRGRADRGARGQARPVGGRAHHGRVPGQVAALAPADQHRRAPRGALLRPGPGPQGHLHQPAPLAARLPPRRRRGGPAHPGRPLPARLRPGHAGSTSPGGSASRRGTPPRCSASWPASWSASSWTASRAGPAPATPGRRPSRTAASACCPTSTRTSSRASPGSGSTRARPPPARSPRRARPGTTRCCWSTAWSAGSGTSGGPAAGSPSRSSRWRELTARQRRELDDEAALVGAVMEATPTLTVGPVTVGPHA